MKIMIANPNSGPGSSSNSDYVTAINNARAAGITVFGYIPTGYGSLSSSDFTTQFNDWKTWYGVSNIFVDEVSSTPSNIAYYQSLTSIVHQTAGAKDILDPGTVPDEGYMNAGDIVVLAENNMSAYMSTAMPSWINGYAPSRIMNLIYNVPDQASMSNVLAKSKANRAGYVYITDDNLPNPWDTLPSYISAEASQAAASCIVN